MIKGDVSMKSKLLGFLVACALIVPFFSFSMELEGQDDSGDFLISDMNDQYPEDTQYFEEEGDMSEMPSAEEEEMTMDEDMSED